MSPNQVFHQSLDEHAVNYAKVIPFSLVNGTHTARIVYDASEQTLKVYLNGSNTPHLTTKNINFDEILGAESNGRAWIGLTAAAGFGHRKHDIHSWEFKPGAPIDPDNIAGAGDCSSCVDSLAAQQAHVMVAGPINPQTGNYTYSQTDLSVRGRRLPLTFRRDYSQYRTRWADEMLGRGWTHNYNAYLIPDAPNQKVVVQMVNGSRYTFHQKTDGTFITPVGFLGRLAMVDHDSDPLTAPIYQLTFRDQTRHLYNLSGQLIRIISQADPDIEDALSLTYGTDNNLATVSDGVTQLSFTYAGTPARLVEVKAETVADNTLLQSVTYGYTGGNLTSVSNLRGGSWTYTYENAQSQMGASRLTAVVDPNGNIVERQVYDAQDRVTEQWQGNPAEEKRIVAIDYSNPPAIVLTDANDQQQTYHYDANNAFMGVAYSDNSQNYNTTIGRGNHYRPAAYTDGKGNQSRLDWDASGRNLLSVEDALQNKTQYIYGNPSQPTLLTEMVDALDNRTFYFYEDSTFPTLPTAMVDAQGLRREFTYTAAGYLAEETLLDATAAPPVVLRRTVHAYDGAGRRTHTIAGYEDGQFDPAAPDRDLITRFFYDEVGRLIETRRVVGLDASSEEIYCVDRTYYNAAGDVIKTIRNAVGARDTEVFDPEQPDQNLITLMDYDFGGRLVKTTDALRRVTLHSYDSLNRLTSVTQNYIENEPPAADVNVSTHYTYDAVGNLISTLDPLGRRAITCYDSLNRPIRSVQNAAVSADYAALCSMARSSTPDPENDLITDLTYDPNGNLISTLDPLGRRDETCYDALNRPVRTVQNVTPASLTHEDTCALERTNPPHATENLITETLYDKNGNVEAVIDAANVKVAYVYDALNRPIETIYNYQNGTHIYDPGAIGYDPPDQDVIFSTDYDLLGNVWYTKDPLHRITLFCYDTLGRQVKRIQNATPSNPQDSSTFNALCSSLPAGSAADENLVTETVYDVLGRVYESRDPLGRVTRYAYDGVDRTLTIVQNAESFGSTPPSITQSSYDALGRVVQRTDANNHSTTFTYDGLGRTITAKNALDLETHYTYNVLGSLLTVTDPLNRTTTFSYDTLNRQVSSTSALGLTNSTTYDALGRVTARTNAKSIRTSFSYDALGRLIEVVENDTDGTRNDPTAPDANVSVKYHYDVAGNLVRLEMPQGSEITYQYDRLNRRTHLNGALTAEDDQWRTDYDVLGRVVGIQAPRERALSGEPLTRTFTYDGADRLTALNFPTQSALDVSFAYDRAGQRLSMSDSVGSTAFSHDGLGRVTAVTDPFNQTIGYTYDAAGRRTALHYPNALTTTYSYDALNRLTAVGDWDAATADLTYSYDAANQLREIRLPNQLKTDLTYDDDGRLLSLSYTHTDTQQVLARYTYTHDPLGNRTVVLEARSITVQKPDLSVPPPPPAPLATPELAPTFVPRDRTPVADVATPEGTPTLDPTATLAASPTETARTLAALTGNPDAPTCEGMAALAWESDNNSDTVGIYRAANNTFYLRNSNTTGFADLDFGFGSGSALLPLAGDWNGDGKTGVGLYNTSSGIFYLKNTLEAGSADHIFVFGTPGDLPIVGDWDGDGIDGIGVYRPGTGVFYLRNALNGDPQAFDYTMVFGGTEWKPIAGDWDGDGVDSIGIYNPNTARFFLTNTLCNCTPAAVSEYWFGAPGDLPLAGDWDGDGADTIGIYRPVGSGFFLNLLNADNTVITLGFGTTGDLPIVGDWDGQYTGVANRQLCHTYDALSRLVETLDREVRHDGQDVRAYTYTYDLRSNRTAQTATIAGVPTLTTYTYDLANRLTSADSTPFSYDPNGNLLSDGALSYTYDAADRLTSAGGVSYAYNGLSARLTQTVGALTTSYLLDLQAGLTQVLAETTNGTTRRYLHGHDIVAQQSDAAWAYFLYDGLGSVRGLSDSHGALFNNLSYDPYGVPYHTASETPLGFTGEHTDPNGRLYLRARYYAPPHGLFLTRDPVEGVWERSASRNGYAYVEGNPTNRTDPSGMTPFCGAEQVLVERDEALRRGIQTFTAPGVLPPVPGQTTSTTKVCVNRHIWEHATLLERALQDPTVLSSVFPPRLKLPDIPLDGLIGFLGLCIDVGIEVGKRIPVPKVQLAARGLELARMAHRAAQAASTVAKAAQAAQSSRRETPELFERFGSESEALAAQVTGKLAFPTEGIGNRQEKWIALPGGEDSFGNNAFYTHKMSIIAVSGTLGWLNANAVLDENIQFPKDPPHPDLIPRGNVKVITKSNEPGRFGLTPLGLPEFNERIISITSIRIR